MSFGETMFLRIKQENKARNRERQVQNHISTKHQVKKDLEDMRRRATEGGAHLA